MITLEHDQLVFRFPEVHEDAECAINFQRTLRIPDSSKDYPLPPGLGEFPLRHLDDYEGRVPKEWQRRGGVMMPMHQSEAMWISFKSYRGEDSYPFAIKIATGKVNAVSGERWTDHLNRDPQDYVVTPDQPWLDGYCVEKGIVRQFIGMPLGKGYSVEEQLTGSAEWGGLQIIVYPLKAEKYLEHLERLNRHMKPMVSACYAMSEPSMSLAPGGRMRQKIFEDNFDLGDWDQRHASRCFVTIVNSVAWSSITGERPTNQPPTSTDYTRAKLPWFEYYGGDGEALDGAEALVKANSVAKVDEEAAAKVFEQEIRKTFEAAESVVDNLWGRVDKRAKVEVNYAAEVIRAAFLKDEGYLVKSMFQNKGNWNSGAFDKSGVVPILERIEIENAINKQIAESGEGAEGFVNMTLNEMKNYRSSLLNMLKGTTDPAQQKFMGSLANGLLEDMYAAVLPDAKSMEIEKGDHVLPENEGCDPYPVVRLGKGKQFRPVREP